MPAGLRRCNGWANGFSFGFGQKLTPETVVKKTLLPEKILGGTSQHSEIRSAGTLMRNAILCLCLAASGCAGHRCCETVGWLAAQLGWSLLTGTVDDAIDSAVDPEPPDGPSLKQQEKHFDWVQRREADNSWEQRQTYDSTSPPD